VGTVPNLSTSLANFLFVLDQASIHLDVGGAAMGLRPNFGPDLAMIGFGIFLLLKGEIVTSWVFSLSGEDTIANE